MQQNFQDSSDCIKESTIIMYAQLKGHQKMSLFTLHRAEKVHFAADFACIGYSKIYNVIMRGKTRIPKGVCGFC